MPPIRNKAVAAKFQAYPPAARRKLLALRALVLRTAASIPETGEIEETLKWGQPAYLTRNGAGTTVRMDWKPKAPAHYALYFHCQTNLVDGFRSLFPRDFRFEGNRALLLPLGRRIPEKAVSACLAAALTYHLARAARARRRR
ncbi:MAG: DUF1801 domain-containing protein [Proteobacteria bacterium]|nr:DUF1801 domain-containing protein [Pseudomonadota bacterium]